MDKRSGSGLAGIIRSREHANRFRPLLPVALTKNIVLLSRRLWVLALAAVVLLIAVGVIAPLLDASQYGERIRQTLQATLGRKVEFEAVHFMLFSGPGFSLEGVTIGEDKRYGIEPFAYVPELQVRVRPDKLLFSQIQISSLRLLQPSLNLVKREDGTWNALEVVQRLSAPRRMPLNFFPVFEVLQGRVDFKFGTKKTTLYLLDSDFQVFPEHSNRFSLRFSGSPARSDRAGNGFGHVHGSVNWILNQQTANETQLEANLTLDPSNLSEMATLVEGHDIGVHGTIASHVTVKGPLSSLDVQGQMQLNDLHRWDLLPVSGDQWQVAYGGSIDLVSNRLLLITNRQDGASAITLHMAVNDFLTSPKLSLLAQLNQIPAAEVLPLGRRMGLAIPANVSVLGNLGGSIKFNNQEGLAGDLVLDRVTATLPDQDVLQADHVEASLINDRLLFRPAQIRTSDGLLQVGGEVWLAASHSIATVVVDDYPINGLKRTLSGWLGSPVTLEAIADGTVSGSMQYRVAENSVPSWAGKVDVVNATVRVPGLATPLSSAAGRFSFNGPSLDVSHFSAAAGGELLLANYRYNPAAKRVEHLRLELPKAELSTIERLLTPTVQGQGWLARLGVTGRSVPAWLGGRDMDAEITVRQFRLGDTNLGSLTSQLTWQGTTMHFSSLELKMPSGDLQARGTANLSSYRPRCSFSASLSRYPWRGGLLNADGEFQTVGLDEEAVRNLTASGTFSAVDIQPNAEESFPLISGNFQLAFDGGWPDLKLRIVQAVDRDGHWTGAGEARSDGRLVVDLERGTQQRQVISTLTDSGDAPALLANH